MLLLHYETTDQREFLLQLVYVDIELIDALHHHPDNRHLVKASRLVQKILSNIELEFKHQTLTITEKKRKESSTIIYKWSTDDVHFVELVYGLIESKSIESENGKVKINEFAEHLGAFLGIELRDSHDTYSSSIKKRKKDDRAYFLNRLAYVINKKMNHEDGIPTPSIEQTRMQFDEN